MKTKKSSFTKALSTKTNFKKIFFILFTLSFLCANAQEGITNITNSNATLGGTSSTDGGIFIAHSSAQERVIVTSAVSSSPTFGPQDIDITLIDNNNVIVTHDVFGVTNGTLTSKDVIVDQFGYVVIVGKIVVTGTGGYDRGFILRMNLSNFATRTFATYDINSGTNDPWFHQILELNLAGSLYGGNSQMAVLASATISGGARKEFIMLVDQTTLAHNSTTMIDVALGYDSRALSPGMGGFRTMTETDGTNNSLAVSGSYWFTNTFGGVEYGIYIVEFTYSSGNLIVGNQQTFESGIYLFADWVLVHDMIFLSNGYNGNPTFYLAGSKMEALGFIPCYLAYSFISGINYVNSVNIVSAPQFLIRGQTNSRMQLINNDILVGNNRGDFYTFNWTSGTVGYIKSVTNAFRPTLAVPFGDFIYDNANTLLYGVTQGAIPSDMQVFTMLPNNTDACCFAVNSASNSTFSYLLQSPTVSTFASGTMNSGTLSTLTQLVKSETLCAYCSGNTMSLSGPDNVFCDDAEYTLEGCSHSWSGYWELIGPLPATTSCSTKIVSSNNASAIINFFTNPIPSLSAGQYKIRYIEDISSETGCLDVLAEKTINFQPTFTGTISMLDNPDCDDEVGIFELLNPQGFPFTSFLWSSSPNGTPVNATVNPSTIDFTGYTGSFTVNLDVSIGGCSAITKTFNFTRQECCSTTGTYQTVQESYKHSYTGKTLGAVVDGQDYTWVMQDQGSNGYSLSQVDNVGKIIQSHLYKGASSDDFKAVDFTEALYSSTTLGVIVAGGKGNKLYVVETDGSGAVVKKRAHTISTCETCSVEVVNIEWTSYEYAKFGVAVLLNLKNTSTGANTVHLVHLYHSNLNVMWIRKLSYDETNTSFVAHRLVTSLHTWEITFFQVLGTITINDVKKGIIFDPRMDPQGYYSTPVCRISNNVYFDGRAIRNQYGITGFIFGGSTDPNGFNGTANAAFLKTDFYLNTVYEKKLPGYHMHALNVIPASGNSDNSVFVLQSRHWTNTGHYFYHLLELDASLNVVSGNVKTFQQYKNTSNDHTPYIAGKNLIRQSSDGGYVFAGQDDTEYDFIVAKVEPAFDEACGVNFSVSTVNNENGTLNEGILSTPSTTAYDLEVDVTDLPLEYICCEDRDGPTFSYYDIVETPPNDFSIPNDFKKEGTKASDVNSGLAVELLEIGVVPDSSIQILPNPSSGIFNIRLFLSSNIFHELHEYNIYVIDLTGKVVYNRNGLQINSDETIDLTSLSYGVYTVMLKIGDSYKYIRIIKC